MTTFFPLARANKQTRINMGDCESQDNEWTNSLQRFHPENTIEKHLGMEKQIGVKPLICDNQKQKCGKT
jgi:hypothetical protein